MEGRKRLRPWLEGMLNGKLVRGLHWVDDEKTTFRIPWKHGGKHDWNPEDAEIFVRWAEHTGKYRPGVDKPDYATFKTRLRCAFNKASDIQEIKEQTNLEDPNPYRIYRLLPKRDVMLKKLGLDQTSVDTPDELDDDCTHLPADPPGPPALPETVEGAIDSTGSMMSKMSIEEPGAISENWPSDLAVEQMPSGDLRLLKGVNVPPSEALDDQNDEKMDTGSRITSLDANQMVEDLKKVLDCSESILPALEVQQQQQLAQQQQQQQQQAFYSVPVTTYYMPIKTDPSLLQSQPVASPPPMGVAYANPASVQSQFSEASQVSPAAFPDISSMQGSPSSAYETGTAQQQQEQQINIFDPRVSDAEFFLQINYSGARVLSGNYSRCCLTYGSAQVQGGNLAPEMQLAIIEDPNMGILYLPPPMEMGLDQKVEKVTTKLLENCTKGLLLECDDGDVYATRCCKSSVFYCSSITGGMCERLARPEAPGANCEAVRQKIFDYKNFLQAWNHYKAYGGNKPDTSAYIFIGQQGSPSELSKVIISVQVTSLKALLRVMESGEPGTPPIEISISNEYNMDSLVKDEMQ